MKRVLTKPLGGALVVAVVVAGLTLLSAGAALAVAPPWEPDPNSNAPYGNVVLYDSAGNVVTGGNNLAHIADYAAATTAKDANAQFATLSFANPDSTKTTSLWTVDSASASTSFPSAAAPAPITGPGFAFPLVTLGASDACLSCSYSGFVHDANPAYGTVVQIRLKDSGPGGAGSGTHYWSTDVQITNWNASNGTGSWSVVYPGMTGTTTSITTTPPSGGSALTGTNVTMQSTVSPAPAANGTVQFFDTFPAAHPVGAPQAVSTGTPTTPVVTDLAPPIGLHHYTAVFTPTGGTLVTGSSSGQSNVTITPPQTGTSVTLSANPLTAPQFTPIHLTANESPSGPGPGGAEPGVMEFFDGGSSLGTQNANDGTAGEYKLDVSSLSVGLHHLHAVFTPTSSSFSQSPSSNVVDVTITAPTCPGDPAHSVCTDTQPIQVNVDPGSITISTPYFAGTPGNPGNVFVLPAMQLDPTATFLKSGPVAFPNPGDPKIVVTSTLAGNPNWTVSVSGTDLTSGANVIDGKGLGLTGGGNAAPPIPATKNIVFTDNPAHNPALADGFVGIKGGPFTFAHTTNGGDGSAFMFGFLTLYAPTSTPSGTYGGTITFSVA
ncbi:MAG TPA: hypothetical protein VK646_13870 [Actinomycetota bacterium]|nr:hypothetical protein [Actinomycetota bacterium]